MSIPSRQQNVARIPNPDPEPYDDEATISLDRAFLSSLSLVPARKSQPVALAPEHAWYLAIDGAESGPFSTSELVAKISGDKLYEEAFVWREGLAAWEELDQIPELRAALKSETHSVAPAVQPSRSTLPPPLPKAAPEADPPKKGSPETLSPMEKLVIATQPISSSRPPALGFSPWHAMTAALVVGLGASFLLLKVLEADDTSEPAPLPAPAVSGRRPPVLRISTDGALDPERIRMAITPALDPTRRDCWRQARETREPNAPPHATLGVVVQVDANGRVVKARHLGEAKGYPGLGACLAAKTRAWVFPSSTDKSQVTLTFGFESR
jgi:hypothetical protein